MIVAANYGKVGILAGGPSSEREISLRSGRAVFNVLKNAGCDVMLIDLKEKAEDVINYLDIDIAFIALHGGFGEDGTVQHFLGRLNIPYTGSDPAGSKAALDKLETKKIFKHENIPTPDYIALTKNIKPQDLPEDFIFPVVVKPAKEGSSIGLSIVREAKDFENALSVGFRYDKILIIEKYIYGRELTVGILDGDSLPVVEIIPKENVYDYSAKYIDADTQYIVPAHITVDEKNTAQELSLKAHNALGCKDFSRVDLRMSPDGKMYVLEVNTIPGLTERSLLPKAAQAAGISFEQLCLKFLDMALRKKKEL